MQRLKVLPGGTPLGWSGNMVNAYYQGLQLPLGASPLADTGPAESVVAGTETTSLLNHKVTAVIHATPMCRLVSSLAPK